jgi:hypothetical protein
MTERRTNGPREVSFENRMLRWFVVVWLAVIGVVLLYKVVSTDSSSGWLLTTLFLIAGLVLLTGAQSFGITDLSLGRQGLRAEIQQVKDRVDHANNKINDLFLLTISPWAYLHLRKLARPEGYGAYEMGPGLSRELHHLLNIGYIEISSMEEIPQRGENLSEFVTITDEGRQFVKLRQELETI